MNRFLLGIIIFPHYLLKSASAFQIPSKKGGRENYKYYDVDGLGNMDRVRFNIQMDKVMMTVMMMTMIGMVVTECVGDHPDSLSCCFGRDTRTRTQGQKTQGHRTQGGKMTLGQKDFTLKDARENRESSNSGIL